MQRIDEQILNIDRVICRHISSAEFSPRGAVSQDILSQLRNFVEHIMLKFYANGSDIQNTYENICKTIEFVKSRGDLKVLYKFHTYLQIVASHYTLDEQSSERLMLKYYEYLVRVKNLLHDTWGLDVLSNLEDFPLNTDQTLQEYYVKIAQKVDGHTIVPSPTGQKIYIQKVKPFFVDQKIYYEVTFTSATDYASKTDRIIAFTKVAISDYYSSCFALERDSIELLGKTMPILIITGWAVAIRTCEYTNFCSLFTGSKTKPSHHEQQAVNKYLTSSGLSLTELIDFSDPLFQRAKQQCTDGVQQTLFFDKLEICRNIVKNHRPGENLIRYLLYRMNNKIIKDQWRSIPNDKLSNLYVQNGSIPFDTMPLISSLIGHNPRLSDLLDCIPAKDHTHELLARCVRNNTEIKGQLFTTVKDLSGFDDIPELVRKYNETLWYGHRGSSQLIIEKGQIFINEYRRDTCEIIERLKAFSTGGVKNYSKSAQLWLSRPGTGVDCDEKRSALIDMFANSRVALIYGSAGTGKSTLINHTAHLFAGNRKLLLAQTNPAIDNLKRRVTASNCTFSTISSFIKSSKAATEYDLLVIDECSTVSNSDMVKVLEKVNTQLLLLVGDVYQINSIRFGNWFSIARAFIPNTSVFELTKPHRSSNESLLLLWDRVRNMNGAILELIARQGYSTSLDASIFSTTEDDEIVLCLNYDGLYGINNINRFLQESNPNPAFSWGIQQYKVGDPVLFNESTRFAPVIYNNMKGRIVGIRVINPRDADGYIQFDVELDKVINGVDAAGQDFTLLDDSERGNSVVRFAVYRARNIDDEDDGSQECEVPFQVAYAVSIHKAQGLEYDSVKIVITDEVDERITHNIFYTAITRARNKLKIYWTPEVEHKVLSNIQPRNIDKDVILLKRYIQ